MIFSPFIFFGHTWEINGRIMTALMERELFLKFFVRHCDLNENNEHYSSKEIKYYRQGSVERKKEHFVSLIITIFDIVKKQLKVKYEYTSQPDVFGTCYEKTGEFILSTPLTLEEKTTLHRLRQRSPENMNMRTALLLNIDMDSYNSDLELYTIRVPGVDSNENLIKRLFDVINK